MQSGALLCFFHHFNNRCVPIGKIINLPQPIYDCLVYMSPCSVSSTSEDKCTTPADNQQMLHFYIYIYLYINDFCGSQALDYYMYFIGLKINTIRAQCEFYVMRIFSQTRYWQDIYSREIKIVCVLKRWMQLLHFLQKCQSTLNIFQVHLIIMFTSAVT